MGAVGALGNCLGPALGGNYAVEGSIYAEHVASDPMLSGALRAGGNVAENAAQRKAIRAGLGCDFKVGDRVWVPYSCNQTEFWSSMRGNIAGQTKGTITKDNGDGTYDVSLVSSPSTKKYNIPGSQLSE